ncbi:alpha-L-rhamnosidase C-terminal domain-containing protein [Xanthocytophaga agilis]|uniref:Alpha-L-rhamnosidase C-terminal domain-containing protein n=1 Tax=Xanthocytophaga agilis TaxID=3048010 RepID=A0AAE3R7R0_9BACT|nr:alpha-L-rhamnosidase C-terminal domain-containing protein [Xanthocytophaga agilis]MDJ1504755.1 alpha-L-rhamnosidase C-terminal domain-containing protein [Xanthocytophaga agilis]
MQRKLLLLCFLVWTGHAFSQNAAVNPALLKSYWQARWIVYPNVSQQAYGIYHFRKTLELTSKPSTFIVHVSADNRYRLLINGQPVASGPARSDLLNWNFETIDLAPYLKAGKNVLAALVWNAAESRPFAQMSYQTGFIMQGNSVVEEVVNTNSTWKAFDNEAYQPLPIDKKRLRAYFVAGDGDWVDGNVYPWGWEKTDFDDTSWQAAQATWFTAKPRGLGSDGNWMLVPREIPMMEEKLERLKTVRRVSGTKADDAFLTGKQPVIIPANSKASILLDQSYLTNAYPELVVSDGKNASITLTYAEALWDAKHQKGNRNEIEGKEMIGMQDRFVTDGGEKRVFRPLWFRTYRYLQLDIETKENPLAINDLYGIFTGYPFKENAYFKTTDPTLAKIWEVGWRTARLCAAESYFDCPYYEQLQYVGDTRVQSMISLYVTGDDKLMRKAILDFDHSRIPDGLTQSRYPCYDLQVIPTFSLFWVDMVHDYWMHRKDEVFVKERLKGVASVLDWHRQRLASNGMLGKLEWWNFVDWSWPWNPAEYFGGVPAGGITGNSSVLALQYAYALQRAAQLFTAFGKNEEAKDYQQTARTITESTYILCWDNSRKLLADTPDKKQFSQHANTMAILTDAIPADQQKELLGRVATDTSITQCTYYYRFYIFEALKKTGLGDQYLSMLTPWKDQLAIGLTTFAENPEPTRSDCHAWSASPLYHFLSLVCGIQSNAPGFEKVKIEPNLGSLTQIDGQVPHPAGNIQVKFQKTKTGMKGEVVLPASVTGELVWKGKTLPLKAGKQTITL